MSADVQNTACLPCSIIPSEACRITPNAKLNQCLVLGTVSSAQNGCDGRKAGLALVRSRRPFLAHSGRWLTREVLREAESRLGAAIDRLGDRLDSLVKELVVSRREPK
jgi:hypothetical protein